MSSSGVKLKHVKFNSGADHTVNYETHPDWVAEVQHITAGRGVDRIMMVGGVGTIPQSIECVADGGIVSVIGFEMADATMTTFLKSCTVRGIQGGSKKQLQEAVRFMANRNVVIPVHRTFAFNREEAVAALEYVESGADDGKVCINLD